jgi:hypothetical protein
MGRASLTCSYHTYNGGASQSGVCAFLDAMKSTTGLLAFGLDPVADVGRAQGEPVVRRT